MNITCLRGILQKKEIPAFILAFTCTFILFPLSFETTGYPILNSSAPSFSLDPSWQITLNYARLKHMDWGNDFMLTYGPLSYLSTRVGWGISRLDFILFDLFISFNFLYIFYTSCINSANRKLTCLLIITATYLLPAYAGPGIAIIIIIFLLFWLRKSLDAEKPFFYIMQMITIALAFFIKFNTGLISVILFFAVIIYKAAFSKENKWQHALYCLLLLCVIFILSLVLNVSLPAYIKGGLELVNGYNGAMYLNNEHYTAERRFSIAISFMAAGLLLFNTWREKHIIPKQLLILFLFSSVIYILYKQAYTRMDFQHVFEYYKYILFLALCFPDLHFNAKKKPANIVMFFIFIIAAFFIRKSEYEVLPGGNRIEKNDYVAGLKGFTGDAGISLPSNRRIVPAKIRNKIGNSSIDIYPWDGRLLIENRLNFTPRPVFQSYTAYTPYLENMNFNFYSSAGAPEYVIYEYETIDGRYPLFDEPKLNLLLLKCYQCIDTFCAGGRPKLLLQKNHSNAPPRLTKLKEYETGLTDMIVPEAGKYYELFTANTLKGKAVSFLEHSPELSIIISTRDGNQHAYKTSEKLLESGIFSDRFFSSTPDLYAFIKNGSAALPADITGYHLQPKDPLLFKNKIKIIEYRID